VNEAFVKFLKAKDHYTIRAFVAVIFSSYYLFLVKFIRKGLYIRPKNKIDVKILCLYYHGSYLCAMEIGKVIQSKFANSQQKAIVNIRYTSNWMAQKQNAFMSQFDLSMAQFNILRILRGANDFLSVNTVKERMVEKSPNTTRLMDKLIEKGLIERVRCEEDRRVVYVKIAGKGLELLARIDDVFNDPALFPNALSDEEAEQLSALLDKLRG
jgi:DNA-binding MarR family transcriptional regulator